MGTFDAGSAGNYRANPNAELEHVIDNYAHGKSTDGTWFGTFCIEFNEYFRNGTTYKAKLNNGSVKGGVSGAVNGKDIISKGTASLYEQFALGTLSGFTYGNKTHARQLQNTIWFLEGEISNPFYGAGYGSFLGLAQGIANYSMDYTGSAVQVLNLTKRTNGQRTFHQDQLVYTGSKVPDTGATLSMLLCGVTGLSYARRRINRRK